MGYAIMPKLEEPTICNFPCKHKDCTYTREFVETAKCITCNEPINSGEWFYRVENKELQHFTCAHNEAEKARETT